MSKDGTLRGGSRVRSGPKSAKQKDFAEGWQECKACGGKLDTVIDLNAPQQDGRELCSEAVYRKVAEFLKKNGAEGLVSPLVIEEYAMSFARWKQCEDEVSRLGMLARHPTTGAPIMSPYVTASQNYIKQVNIIWFQIVQAMKGGGGTAAEDEMEGLLDG